jgi:hypothetical protein
MEKVLITRVYKSDKKKDGTDLSIKGKKAWKVGIKTEQYGDKWFSALAFEEDSPLMDLKEGDEVSVVIWEKGGFMNFKLPTKLDLLEARIEAIEKYIKNTVEKDTKGYVYPDAPSDDVPF